MLPEPPVGPEVRCTTCAVDWAPGRDEARRPFKPHWWKKGGQRSQKPTLLPARGTGHPGLLKPWELSATLAAAGLGGPPPAGQKKGAGDPRIAAAHDWDSDFLARIDAAVHMIAAEGAAARGVE